MAYLLRKFDGGKVLEYFKSMKIKYHTSFSIDYWTGSRFKILVLLILKTIFAFT